MDSAFAQELTLGGIPEWIVSLGLAQLLLIVDVFASIPSVFGKRCLCPFGKTCVEQMVRLEKEANKDGLSYKEMMARAGTGLAELVHGEHVGILERVPLDDHSGVRLPFRDNIGS